MSDAKETVDLAREVRDLRNEIEALRKIVSGLYHAVFEEPWEDDVPPPVPDDHVHTFDLN